MEKLSFEKFTSKKVSLQQTIQIKGGDTAGGGRWLKGGSPGNIYDIYQSWSSDYTDATGALLVRDNHLKLSNDLHLHFKPLPTRTIRRFFGCIGTI